MLQDTIAKLLGEEAEKSTKDELAKWLEDYENELYGDGLSSLNYHIVVAKGLFNSSFRRSDCYSGARIRDRRIWG